MAEQTSGSGSNTGIAIIVGGLVVAVGFLIYFLFGDQIMGPVVTDTGTTVNVETTTGSSGDGGTSEGTSGGASGGASGESSGGADSGSSGGGSTEGSSGN